MGRGGNLLYNSKVSQQDSDYRELTKKILASKHFKPALEYFNQRLTVIPETISDSDEDKVISHLQDLLLQPFDWLEPALKYHRIQAKKTKDTRRYTKPETCLKQMLTKATASGYNFQPYDILFATPSPEFHNNLYQRALEVSLYSNAQRDDIYLPEAVSPQLLAIARSLPDHHPLPQRVARELFSHATLKTAANVSQHLESVGWEQENVALLVEKDGKYHSFSCSELDPHSWQPIKLTAWRKEFKQEVRGVECGNFCSKCHLKSSLDSRVKRVRYYQRHNSEKLLQINMIFSGSYYRELLDADNQKQLLKIASQPSIATAIEANITERLDLFKKTNPNLNDFPLDIKALIKQ